MHYVHWKPAEPKLITPRYPKAGTETPKVRLGVIELNNPKVTSDYKFYQKLFLVFLGMSIFLIFPESPGDSEKLCKKYNSAEVCNIW